MSLHFPTKLRFRSAALIGAIACLALSGRAQVTSLTDSSSLFETVRFNGTTLGDTFDAGNAGLDPSKQSGLNGSASNWDLVGDSTRSLLQVSFGATDTYFRLRLADYKASGNSGSAIILLNDGTSTFGLGVLLGTKNDGTYYLTPATGTTLTAGFQYTTPTLMQGATSFNYSTVASIDSGSTSISANDAFITFRVLNSDLTAKAAPFAISEMTSFTAFTNNNSVWNTNINADYISFGATTASPTNPLTFGTVPEPATWVSTGAMIAFGGLVWWRRRKARPAA